MFANQYTQPTVEFGVGPDARQGLGLVRAIWRRVQGFRTHPYGPEKADPSITWNGLAQNPQDFRGLAAPLGNGTPYTDGAYPDISTGLVEGPMGDPARRIFAQRLARQTSIGGL